MKIDTSKIENYESMSAEEKLKALETYEMEFDTTGYVKKDLFDKTSSEVSSLKKQLKEKLSEEEQAKLRQTEEFNAMKEKLEALEKEKSIQEHTNQFLALGYEQELAEKTAKALYEGNLKVVFENQKAFQESLVKNERANLLKDTPKPQVGNENTTVTKDILKGMSLSEKQQWAKEHPTEYENFYK